MDACHGCQENVPDYFFECGEQFCETCIIDSGQMPGLCPRCNAPMVHPFDPTLNPNALVSDIPTPDSFNQSGLSFPLSGTSAHAALYNILGKRPNPVMQEQAVTQWQRLEQNMPNDQEELARMQYNEMMADAAQAVNQYIPYQASQSDPSNNQVPLPPPNMPPEINDLLTPEGYAEEDFAPVPMDQEEEQIERPQNLAMGRLPMGNLWIWDNPGRHNYARRMPYYKRRYGRRRSYRRRSYGGGRSKTYGLGPMVRGLSRALRLFIIRLKPKRKYRY